MQHLSDTQIATLRQRLLAERDRLQAQLEAMVPTQPDDADPGDVQDHARSEREIDQWRVGIEHARRLLAPVEDALRRMERGTYGLCLETGEPIPYARLEVQPTAVYSIEVQQALEEDEESSLGAATKDSEPY